MCERGEAGVVAQQHLGNRMQALLFDKMTVGHSKKKSPPPHPPPLMRYVRISPRREKATPPSENYQIFFFLPHRKRLVMPGYLQCNASVYSSCIHPPLPCICRAFTNTVSPSVCFSLPQGYPWAFAYQKRPEVCQIVGGF